VARAAKDYEKKKEGLAKEVLLPLFSCFHFTDLVFQTYASLGHTATT